MVDALAEAERNFGKLHIACNNAGVPMHGTGLVDVPPGDWEFVIGVNIWGIIHGIRHFVPAILRHGEEGHVVITSSSVGVVAPTPNGGIYNMTKAAGANLAETLYGQLSNMDVAVSASVLVPERP